MKYKEFKPSAELAEYIQLIWFLESENEEELYPRERILPDGIIEMVFHYNDPFFTYSTDGVKQKQPQAFIISQLKEFIELESDGEMGFISVRFFPWGAYHFFDKPIKDVVDNTYSLKEVYPDSIDRVLNELKNSNSEQLKVKLIESFLLDQFNKHERNDKTLDQAIKELRNSGGAISIDELCEKFDLSRRSLERNFLNSIGTTPKVFSRVCRFLNLCHNLKDFEGKNLTELTYDCGYFDQSHFIKEFKSFSGFTPKEYFKQNNVSFADI